MCPDGISFKRALILVASLYPLPRSLRESLVLPLFSQTFFCFTLTATALSEEIVVVHLPGCICNPVDYSMPDLAVPHYLLKFAQIYVHPTISSSVTPYFSSCLQSFPASGIFSNEWAFHIKWPKHIASVLLMNIQG